MESPVLWIVLAVVLVALFWTIANYNRFVRLRHHVRESWADVDVELKRRYELIPNLVATVKGYAQHERLVLERVTEMRNKAAANHGPADLQAVDENALLRALRQVFVVAESYPQLKSDRNFLSLQDELAVTEDRIAAARRFYNGNVRELRQLCEMFPTSVLAGLFKFEKPTFFELESAAERVVPRVH